jgi:dolichol kinase
MQDLVPFYPEVSRKLLHLASAITPVTYHFVGRPIILALLGLCLAIAMAVEWLRRSNPAFGSVYRTAVGGLMRPREWTRLTGATYVLLGAFVSVALFPKPIAIAVLLIAAVSDSAAALVGLRFGRSRFLTKSLAGSTAFFVTALAILLWTFPDQRGVALIAALVATLFEAAPAPRLGYLELNDNIVVPTVTGLLICLLTKQNLLFPA